MRILSFFIAICFLFPGFLAAQDYIFKADTWELKDGLCNRHVNTVCEDAYGFIWVATRNGLQRFDGMEFKTWSERTGFPQFGDIRNLILDDGGWLWAWDHNKGEYSFIHTVSYEVKTQKERFGDKIPRTKDKLPVPFSAADADKKIYALAVHPNRLIAYSSKKGFEVFPLNFVGDVSQLEMVALSDRGISICARGEKTVLYQLNLKGELLHELVLEQDREIFFHRNKSAVTEIILYEYLQSEDAWSQGSSKALKLDWYEGALKPLKQSASLRAYAHHAWSFDISEGVFSIWKNDALCFSAAIKDEDVIFKDGYPCFVDSKNRLWVCSSFGLRRISFRESAFQRLVCNGEEPTYPFNTAMRSISVQNDTLYGLFEFNGVGAVPLKNPNTLLPLHGRFTFDAHYYNTYAMIRQADALVCVREGKITRIKQGKVVEIPVQAFDAQGRLVRKMSNKETVFSLLADGTTLWVGATDGLWKINSKGKGTYFSLSGTQSQVIRDIGKWNKVLYLCSGQGLLRFDPSTGKSREVFPGGIRERQYYCITIRKGEVYLGTNKGLLVWNPESDKVKQYNEKDGLSQNTVSGVYPDELGNVWIATFYGLNKLNLKSGRITSYYEADGISHSEFNLGSHFQDEHGLIYFGGLNGLTVIDPGKINARQAQSSSIQLTHVEVFSEDEDRLFDITGEVRNANAVVYHLSDRFVKLKFAIPNLDNPTEVLYAWKIEGLHDSWNYQKENSIQLTDLPYGAHRLSLKGKTDEGIWTQAMIIEIEVERPFYATLWFGFLVFAALVFLVVLIFRWRTRQLKRKAVLLREQIQLAVQQIEEDKELILKQSEELRAMDQAKSRFFANITHELKTPLALIKGPLGTVLNSKDLSPENLKHLHTARRNTDQLLKLVSSLLDLSKFDNGMLQVEEIEVNLADFVRVLLSHFESHAAQAEIELSARWHFEQDLLVRLDKNKCETILNNLLANAIKFTPSGGKIQVEIRDEGNTLRFSVKDTGRGIAKEEQEKIFERFYQVAVDGRTEEGGTGIGLSLSREFARLMQGSLDVESAPGQGSTFTFTLPKKEVKGIALPQQVDEPSIEECPKINKAGEGHILIVEDNADLREYVSQIMMRSGYSTSTAMNGKKALELLDQLAPENLPQLILSDIMMPEMDGYELLSHLKQNALYWSIPVVMLTARSELQDKLKALRIGVDDYLLKPFEEEELLARVQNLLNQLKGRTAELTSEETEETTLSYLDQKWLSELEEYVQNGMKSEEFDVSILHDHFAMSSSTFLRKVRALTGMTPADYLRENRLSVARRMLENREKESVLEVAYEVGYANPKSFSRSFRNRFGKLPGDYLK